MGKRKVLGVLVEYPKHKDLISGYVQYPGVHFTLIDISSERGVEKKVCWA